MLRLKQARNQLMISGEAKCFLKRPKIFQLCPIVLYLDYVQHIFSGGGENFSRGSSHFLHAPGYGPGLKQHK